MMLYLDSSHRLRYFVPTLSLYLEVNVPPVSDMVVSLLFSSVPLLFLSIEYVIDFGIVPLCCCVPPYHSA